MTTTRSRRFVQKPARADDRVATFAHATLAVALVLGVGLMSAVRGFRFWTSGVLGADARETIDRAQPLLHGVSPYPANHYPPLSLLVLAPFGHVPEAHLVLASLALACVPITLRLLGVRDWRCYAAALMWASVSAAVQTANATIFIVLAMAVAWRYRDMPMRAGVASAVAISLKLLSWPLVVWLWATRRIKAVGWCVAGVALAVPGLLGLIVVFMRPAGGSVTGAASSFSNDLTTPSYGIDDLLAGAGAPRSVAHAAFLGASLAMAVAAAVFGKRGDDERSFAAAAIATLLAAPNLWPHSFSFLLLAIGVRRPRFSAVWVLPILMFGLPSGDPDRTALVVAWAVLAVIAFDLLGSDTTRRFARIRGVRPSIEPRLSGPRT